MKHYNLISNLFLFSVVLFSASAISSCAPEKKAIGIQLYSVRDAIGQDVEGTLAKVGEIGYNYAEAAGYSDGKFYGMEPEAFKAAVEKSGMQLVSSHTSHSVPDSAGWDQAMAWWDQCIDAHKRAGCAYIVQPSMDHVGYESLDGLKRYCDYFNAVGEKCNAQGIRFGYHNHNKEFGPTADSLVTNIYEFMLANTDPAKVMFQMDVYWCTVGGKNPIDYFNANPGRFELLHIKDKEELGASGMMDFKPIYESISVAGAKYCIVEVERYNFEPIESLKMSYDFLNNAEYVK